MGMWKDSLKINVTSIDYEHEQLFDKADKLFEAGKNGNSKEYVLELFDFLEKYTRIHFSNEEKYMLSVNYPEYESQQNMHKYFIKRLNQLRREYELSEGNISILISVNKLVLEWLTRHITMEDRKIAEFTTIRGL